MPGQSFVSALDGHFLSCMGQACTGERALSSHSIEHTQSLQKSSTVWLGQAATGKSTGRIIAPADNHAAYLGKTWPSNCSGASFWDTCSKTGTHMVSSLTSACISLCSVGTTHSKTTREFQPETNRGSSLKNVTCITSTCSAAWKETSTSCKQGNGSSGSI